MFSRTYEFPRYLHSVLAWQRDENASMSHFRSLGRLALGGPSTSTIGISRDIPTTRSTSGLTFLWIDFSTGPGIVNPSDIVEWAFRQKSRNGFTKRTNIFSDEHDFKFPSILFVPGWSRWLPIRYIQVFLYFGPHYESILPREYCVWTEESYGLQVQGVREASIQWICEPIQNDQKVR